MIEEIQGLRIRASRTLSEVSTRLGKCGLISHTSIYSKDKVHGYYHMAEGVRLRVLGSSLVSSAVLHVQVYPGMSNRDWMMTWARVMDSDRLGEIRSGVPDPYTIVGNEHEAAVARLLDQQTIGWEPDVLAGIIQDRVL